jgi:hypothetical protein
MDRGKLPVGPFEFPLRLDRGASVRDFAGDLDVLRGRFSACCSSRSKTCTGLFALAGT